MANTVGNTTFFSGDAFSTCPTNSTYNSVSNDCKCDYGYKSNGSSCIYDYSPTITPTTPTCPLNSYYDGSSCSCDYGFSVSGGLCVSNSIQCHSQLGYRASYDSASRQCKCDSGYVIGTSGQCVDANSYCFNQLGAMAWYNSSSQKCECLAGYRFNGTSCVSEIIVTPTTIYKNKPINKITVSPNDWVDVSIPASNTSLTSDWQDVTPTSTTVNNANEPSFWGDVLRYINPFNWFN